VTDSAGVPPTWQSPSGAVPPPPQPGYAAPPPGFPAPPPGYYQGGIPGGGYPGGWAPPPRPGLIPLAPLTLGNILGASFRVLRRNPRPVVGTSLIIHVIIAAVTIVASLFVGIGSAIDSLMRVASEGEPSVSAATSFLGTALLADGVQFLIAALGLVGGMLLQGIISIEIARGTVGERLTFAQLWRGARGRIGALVGWAFAIVGIIIGVALVFVLIAVLVGVGVTAAGGGTGATIGFVFLTFAVIFLGGGVLGAWLWTKLSFVPNALVIERLTLGRAMKRSWTLVRGYFWRTFGIQLLVTAMVAIATSIVTAPVGIVAEFVVIAANPTDPTSGLASAYGTIQVVSSIIGAIIGTIGAIITSSTTTLLYIDLRIRKEGLDLALLRFVDARQAGATDVPDPYAPYQPAMQTVGGTGVTAPGADSPWA
jgi:hypothetical protein